MHLDVGRVQAGPGPEEPPGLHPIGGERTLSFGDELGEVLLGHGTKEASLAVRQVADPGDRVVLEVQPHPGNLGDRGNLERRQLAPPADARQHQQLGRVVAAGTQEHFPF